MNTPDTLAALIDLAAARHDGASGRHLADIARAAGYTVSHATINNVRSGKTRDISVDTAEAIAHLSGEPVQRVREIAGLPRGELGPYRPPEESRLLSERQRGVLDDLIRLFATPDRRPVSATPSAAAESAPSQEDEKTERPPVVASEPSRPVKRRRSVPKPARQDDHALAASEREIEDWDTTPGA